MYILFIGILYNVHIYEINFHQKNQRSFNEKRISIGVNIIKFNL